jgi:hypothetical protein
VLIRKTWDILWMIVVPISIAALVVALIYIGLFRYPTEQVNGVITNIVVSNGGDGYIAVQRSDGSTISLYAPGRVMVLLGNNLACTFAVEMGSRYIQGATCATKPR